MSCIFKYVLTGGPCTGKTTLLNFFGQQGYQTVSESATIIMQQEREKGNVRPWDDLIYFQTLLLNKQIEMESKLQIWPQAFADRGTLDGLAYCKLFNTHPPAELIKRASENRYAGVFMLDFLPFYTLEGVRFESARSAYKIQNLLKQTYQEFGYQIIEVPVFEIGIRAEFILNKIDYSFSQPQGIKTRIHEDAKSR